jgi:DNA polymerase-3 subunit epsilon
LYNFAFCILHFEFCILHFAFCILHFAFCILHFAFMIDFAAIDFETANGKRTSVCAVGVVVVRGGEIAESLYTLIRPRPNYYSRFTTAIHGITYHDTIEAPDFSEVWQLIAPRIDGLELVAHNSPFDEGCLRAVFELYGMPYPDYRFHCTCRASRRTFGNALPNHQLHTVSAACGYDLHNHHHALADAEACARIALKIL